VDIEEFPNLKKWEEMLEQRPAIRKGRDVPRPYRGKVSLKNEEENERRAREASEWIMKGMKEDTERKHKI